LLRCSRPEIICIFGFQVLG